MDYENGLVSIIIPTYRRSEKLKRAIKSVLNQTYTNIECIVVNDNSSGDAYSHELYKNIGEFDADKRFIFIEQDRHINGAAARNAGIRRARGEFIAFLDDDDWWKTDKIEKQIFYFRQHEPLCKAVSTLVEFYRDGQLERKSRKYEDGKIYKEILRREIDVTTCSIMIKRSALDDTGYFDITLPRHQEIQLLTYFTHIYELHLLPEYLTCVDITDGENNPTSDRIINIKKLFFTSVQPIMDSLPHMEQNRIRALHSLEIAYVEFREKKYGKAIKHMLPVMRDPKTFVLAVKRIFNRVSEGRNRGN